MRAQVTGVDLVTLHLPPDWLVEAQREQLKALTAEAAKAIAEERRWFLRFGERLAGVNLLIDSAARQP